MRLGGLRSMTATMKTGIPGPEGSISEVGVGRLQPGADRARHEVLGPEGLRVGTEWTYRFCAAAPTRSRAAPPR